MFGVMRDGAGCGAEVELRHLLLRWAGFSFWRMSRHATEQHHGRPIRHPRSFLPRLDLAAAIS
jgi:hypothetical protein